MAQDDKSAADKTESAASRLETNIARLFPRGDGDEETHRPRGIYLLPNLITTAALFAGFYAIVAGMDGAFEKAAIAIIVAGFLDSLDGRVARLTNTQSTFGAEYDSLSDMVAFGVAPALVCFSWALSQLGNLGWVAMFIYGACAALRLARFNTHPDQSMFRGLASPAGAGVIAGVIWVWSDYELGVPSIEVAALAAAMMILVAGLMVSNFRYYSPKGLNLKGRVPFVTLIVVVVIFALIFLDPPKMMLGMALIYAASGPLQALWRTARRDSGAATPGQ